MGVVGTAEAMPFQGRGASRRPYGAFVLFICLPRTSSARRDLVLHPAREDLRPGTPAWANFLASLRESFYRPG
jgi:hypothetical protein